MSTDDKSLAERFCKLGKTIGKASPVEQLIIGGVTGWSVGFLGVKFGKVVALSVGGTLLILQLASYNSGDKNDWSERVENKAKEMKDKFDREVLGKEKEKIPTGKQIQQFIRDHTYLTGGFIAGVFLGIGSA